MLICYFDRFWSIPTGADADADADAEAEAVNPSGTLVGAYHHIPDGLF